MKAFSSVHRLSSLLVFFLLGLNEAKRVTEIQDVSGEIRAVKTNIDLSGRGESSILLEGARALIYQHPELTYNPFAATNDAALAKCNQTLSEGLRSKQECDEAGVCDNLSSRVAICQIIPPSKQNLHTVELKAIAENIAALIRGAAYNLTGNYPGLKER